MPDVEVFMGLDVQDTQQFNLFATFAGCTQPPKVGNPRGEHAYGTTLNNHYALNTKGTASQ